MSPLVTLALPVRNGAPLLREAIDSMLAQDYPNIEILISDNASTDETAAILQDYQSCYPTIRVLRQPTTVPAVENFFILVREAKGEFFAWGAHDDSRSSNFVSALIPAMQKSHVVLSFGDLWIVDGQGRLSKRGDYDCDNRGLPLSRRLRKTAEMQCYHIFGLWRTEALRRIDAAYTYTHWWSDMPIMLAAASLGTTMQVPGPRLVYREVVKPADQRAAYQDNRSSVSRPVDVFSLIYASFRSVSRLGAGYRKAGVLAALFISQKWSSLIVHKLTRTGPYRR